MAAPAEVLIVFAKHPEPGRVKTRLAPALGERLAARVYRRLAARTLGIAADPPAAGREVRVWVEPAARVPDAPGWIGPADAFLPQPDGDLGARMSRAFDDAFAAGARRAVIVGTDLPDLERTDLDAAFARLSDHGAVLGPAADGGYWLLGLRAPAPGLFSAMAWSTEGVLDETRRRLDALGLVRHELRTLRDVDRPEDWLELADRVPGRDVDRWTPRFRTPRDADHAEGGRP